MTQMQRRAIAGALAGAALGMAACAAVVQRGAVVPRAFEDADSVMTRSLVQGVTYSFVRDTRGPWAIHVVEIDTRSCTPALEARKPGRDLGVRATTSELAAGSLAAVNADFFMLPRGTPVGAHVTAGVPLTGPTDRPVFAVTAAGWRIGRAELTGSARAGADTAALEQVNRSAAATSAYRGTTTGVTLFTSWFGDSVPPDSAARRVILRVLDGNEAGGRAVVIASDSPAAVTAVPAGGAVMFAHGTARGWARRRAPGDTVAWQARIRLDGAAIEAVGGFPTLLSDGRPVLAQQTVAASFGAARHPRTAIGWTPDDRLLLVVVDGRQPGYSAGMSLDELTWLFRRLGASDALNLDGGGSTAMVVEGRLVSRPSDREGERAVGNALALTGCG